MRLDIEKGYRNMMSYLYIYIQSPARAGVKNRPPNSGKRIAACLFFFVLLWCVFPVVPRAAGETPDPEMVLPEKVFHAGEVKENDIIEHTFTVRNRGDGPLEIKKVKPG